MKFGLAIAALTMMAALSARAATAEDNALLRDGLFAHDRTVSVETRLHPDYAPVPIHAGAFTVLPSLAVTVEGDDNIYAAPSGETADTVVRVRPAISAASTWSRHALTLFAGLAAAYAGHAAENTVDYTVGLDGRLDAHRDVAFAGGAHYSRETESRADTASQTLVNGLIAQPVRYDLGHAYGDVAYAAGHYRFTGRISADDYSYDNARTASGLLVYQSDRDRTVWTEGGRAEYAVTPSAAVYGGVAFNQRRFRNAALGEVLRDSAGYNAQIGIDVDLTHLIQGEAAVGYLSQTYVARLYPRASGLSFDGKMRWFPTPLTTVTVSARRSVEDAGFPNVGGYLATSLAVQVDHELLRNLILSARVARERDDYRGYGRRDARTLAHAGARFLMNRAVTLSLAFDHEGQASAGLNPAARYAINRIQATLAYAF